MSNLPTPISADEHEEIMRIMDDIQPADLRDRMKTGLGSDADHEVVMGMATAMLFEYTARAISLFERMPMNLTDEFRAEVRAVQESIGVAARLYSYSYGKTKLRKAFEAN